MTILIVCHDTGNTNVLLTSAKTLLEKFPNIDIKFLVVGTAAEIIFNKAENAFLGSNVIRLTSWLAEKEVSKLNQRPLTSDEIKLVAAQLQTLQPSTSITGCSSGTDALIPFQIVEMLTQQLTQDDTNFLYNGDFFQDVAKNPFWTCLSEQWIEKISLFVAFSEAVKQVLARNEKAHVYLAGNTALDSVLDTTVSQTDLETVQQTLDVAANQKLLFIAGSKFVEDDLNLLTCLSDSLRNNPDTAVRMGMHPGTEDVVNYINKIFTWLNTEKIHSLKLVVNDSIARKLTEQMRNNDCIKVSNISGDQIFPAANAIASSLPSTLATQAIMKQRPSFCLDDYKHLSYMHAFFAQSDELFQSKNDSSKLDRTKLGLPAERTVDIIGEALVSASRR